MNFPTKILNTYITMGFFKGVGDFFKGVGDKIDDAIVTRSEREELEAEAEKRRLDAQIQKEKDAAAAEKERIATEAERQQRLADIADGRIELDALQATNAEAAAWLSRRAGALAANDVPGYLKLSLAERDMMRSLDMRFDYAWEVPDEFMLTMPDWNRNEADPADEGDAPPTNLPSDWPEADNAPDTDRYDGKAPGTLDQTYTSQAHPQTFFRDALDYFGLGTSGYEEDGEKEGTELDPNREHPIAPTLAELEWDEAQPDYGEMKVDLPTRIMLGGGGAGSGLIIGGALAGGEGAAMGAVVGGAAAVAYILYLENSATYEE